MSNTHNIAQQLELILRNEFGFSDRPSGTIFDADAIEHTMFYDIMILLLYKKDKLNDTFLDKYSKYKGMSVNEITDCEAIFNEFQTYYNS